MGAPWSRAAETAAWESTPEIYAVVIGARPGAPAYAAAAPAHAAAMATFAASGAGGAAAAAAVAPAVSLLTSACEVKSREMFFQALRERALPDADTIFAACEWGSYEVVKAAFDVGARAEDHDRDNPVEKNVLNSAIKTGNSRIVDLAYGAGSRPNQLSLFYALCVDSKKEYSSGTRFIEKIAALPGGNDHVGLLFAQACEATRTTKDPRYLKYALDLEIPKTKECLDQALLIFCGFEKRHYCEIEVEKLLSLGVRPENNCLMAAVRAENLRTVRALMQSRRVLGIADDAGILRFALDRCKERKEKGGLELMVDWDEIYQALGGKIEDCVLC